tara:strand:+ start:801 stop:1127 length:327 start_codon:yes stop_codon:yes gene_type:complete
MYTKIFNCFFGFIILLSSSIYAQVVVPNKLKNPDSQIDNATAKRSQIWISGEWVVDKDNYIWKNGFWADKRPGFIFLPGYWKEMANGWTWISGAWKEISLETWQKIYS